METIEPTNHAYVFFCCCRQNTRKSDVQEQVVNCKKYKSLCDGLGIIEDRIVLKMLV